MISRPLARIRPADRWIAAGFVVAAVIEALVRYRHQPVQLAINVPGAFMWSCLALRRARPLLTVSIITALGIAGSAAQAWLAPDASTNSDVAIFALLVATYSLGAHGTRRDVAFGAPLPVLVILAVDLLQPSDEPVGSGILFATFFVVIVPIIGGRLVRSRALLVAQLREQAGELAERRNEPARAELARERLRLAEEFHSSLVSGMAALAGRVEHARASCAAVDMAEIEQSARDLLAQTRRAVTSLADPQPAGCEETADAARRRWVRRPEALPWTALAAAALCAGLIAELGRLPLHVAAPLGVLACAGLAVPLAFAWLAPLAMTVATWLFVAGFDSYVASLDHSFAAIGLAFAPPFAVAALATRWRAVAGLGVCCAGELTSIGSSGVLIIAFSWVAGTVLRERATLVDQLRRNAAVLAEQRAAAAQRAVLEERARVARELHDTLGHSLTVVALQAGAARRMWDTDRTRAAAIVVTLAAVTHDGLVELRSGFDAGQPPQVDGRSLDALIDSARSAGLSVDAALDDVAALLDPRAAVVAYRVVQESLTNILKHAPGATAQVSVRASGEHVELAVTNSRGRPAAEVPGPRHGLTGMRARVIACGGQLEWGAQPNGGFRVCARLPAALVPSA